MTYDSPQPPCARDWSSACNRGASTGIALNRLRRRVVFERIVFRIDAAEPGRWVVKGGMALEVRMPDDARTTKDLDLGLREDGIDSSDLRDRLIDALATDPTTMASSLPSARRSNSCGGDGGAPRGVSRFRRHSPAGSSAA